MKEPSRSIKRSNVLNLVALVGAGGIAGAGGRVYLEAAMASKGFPTATFVINLAGAFILGIVVTLAQSSYVQDAARFRALFGTGVCGGFTTFSTATLEDFNLFSPRSIRPWLRVSNFNHYWRGASGIFWRSVIQIRQCYQPKS